jgi:hypothetical protein
MERTRSFFIDSCASALLFEWACCRRSCSRVCFSFNSTFFYMYDNNSMLNFMRASKLLDIKLYMRIKASLHFTCSREVVSPLKQQALQPHPALKPRSFTQAQTQGRITVNCPRRMRRDNDDKGSAAGGTKVFEKEQVVVGYSRLLLPREVWYSHLLLRRD